MSGADSIRLLAGPSYKAKCVDITNATQNVRIGRGWVAKMSFSNATSVQIPLAVQSGDIYELIGLTLTPWSSINPTRFDLRPNGELYSAQFKHLSCGANQNTTYGSSDSLSGIPVMGGSGSSISVLWITTPSKGSIEWGGSLSSGPYYNVKNAVTLWADNTTEWTSLGTMVSTGSASSGVLYIRRLW